MNFAACSKFLDAKITGAISSFSVAVSFNAVRVLANVSQSFCSTIISGVVGSITSAAYCPKVLY